MSHIKIKRALLSVSDKTGIVELGQALSSSGVEILSTGGTFKTLLDAGVPVVEVSSYTGFPEMMDGRVKTLHPKIHGGILGRRATDQPVMDRHGIAAIDLVVVNLYPFAQTIARPDCTEAMAIENIDIGGPAMVRSAAKNYQDVLVVVNPEDYDAVVAGLSEGFDEAQRRQFAVDAFRHTAQYDATVAGFLGVHEPRPERLSLTFRKIEDLRYGENPHQKASFYKDVVDAGVGNIGHYEQHQGKRLSYNNIADTDAALECVKAFEAPACVIVKHANPCGVGVAGTINDAYDKAFKTDPTSAFGGIVAFNRPLDENTLMSVLNNQFVEVLIAPSIDAAAVAAAKGKKHVRLLSSGHWDSGQRGLEFKRVGGCLLVQDADEWCLDEAALRVVSAVQPTQAEMQDLLFAWKVAWFVKSNAIVYARELQTVGVGAGQMSRVVSAKIAGLKAREEGLVVRGAVMASDAFFPFRDGIDAAAAEGVSAVIQPGGSVRDEEVIAAADEHGISMVFTGVRHFRH